LFSTAYTQSCNGFAKCSESKISHLRKTPDI